MLPQQGIRMPKLLQNTLVMLALSIIMIIIAYWYIDKPTVYWAYHHQFRHYVFFDWFTHIPEILSFSVLLIYPFIIVRYCYDKQVFCDRLLLAMANSMVISAVLCRNLKIIFGRYWPATWTNNNLSLIHDNVYGFNWFHIGKAYESFPSGHTTAICAAMITLWLFIPKLRWLAGLLIAVVIIGLIAMDYHFISDIIAGATLGSITAYFVYHRTYAKRCEARQKLVKKPQFTLK